MSRIVVEKVIGEDPWYAVTCERCNTYLGLLAARMWARHEADHYPCHVCEPRALGCFADPQDAIDFSGGDDLALAAVNGSYAQDLAARDAQLAKDSADRVRRHR